MPANPWLAAGRLLQTLVAITTSTGCYLADYNETHVFNPNWSPHAKFHNGQTMSFGLTLGLITDFFIWRPILFSSFLPSISPRDSAVLATLSGSLYWVCGLSAIFYPGTSWIDPEFKANPTGSDEVGPQAIGFSVLIGIVWVGLWLTLHGLDLEKKKIS